MSEEKNTEAQGRKAPAPIEGVQDVEGHGRRTPAPSRNDSRGPGDVLPPAKIEATDDGIEDVEGQGRRLP